MTLCSNDAPNRKSSTDHPRHWYRTTGLPGWKRAQLGMPAFGDPHCVTHPRPNLLRRLINAVKRRLAGRKPESADPSKPTTRNRKPLNNT